MHIIEKLRSILCVINKQTFIRQSETTTNSKVAAPSALKSEVNIAINDR